MLVVKNIPVQLQYSFDYPRDFDIIDFLEATANRAEDTVIGFRRNAVYEYIDRFIVIVILPKKPSLIKVPVLVAAARLSASDPSTSFSVTSRKF